MAWGGARPNSGPKKGPDGKALKKYERKKSSSSNDARTPIDAEAKTAPNQPPPPRPMFSDEAIQSILRAVQENATRARNRPRTMEWNPYVIRPELFGPGAARAIKAKPQLAMDKVKGLAADNAVAVQAWQAGGLLGNAAAEGLLFLGYPYLAELAQRPEFRLFGEIRSQEMTRKWTDLRGTDDESTKEEKKPKERNKTDEEATARRQRTGEKPRSDARNKEIESKIKELRDAEREFRLRDWFRDAAAQDDFFGIGHLMIDLKGTDPENQQDPELKKSIGNGRDAISKNKLERGCLRGFRTIEAVWTYPMAYNAVNPLIDTWYDPQSWFVMGTEIHKTRLLSFTSRPVPDILKPAYMFGGLSMTQMAQPYVDIWLRTRESVGEIIHAFSVMVLATDLGTTTMPGGFGGGGGDVLARVALFNILRDNQGTFVINKNTEEFKNVAAPLGTLDALQAQSQEHMASVARIPVVKFTGLQPKGLNACLPGDTLISTDRGQVPIRDVTLSDLVLTRDGYAPLAFSGITKYATDLIEIKTPNTVLRCTANHPIWLPLINAFVPAENVRPGDLLLSIGAKNVTPKMRHPWHGAGGGGGKEKTDITSHGTLPPSEWFFFIGKCGRHIAALSQRVFKFITSTAISKIISSPILSRCTPLSMPNCTISNWTFFGGFPDQGSGIAFTAAQSSFSAKFRAERNFAATPVHLPTEDRSVHRKQKDHQSAFALCAANLSAQLAKTLNFARANVQPRAKTAPDISAPIISRILKNIRATKGRPDETQLAAFPKNAADAAMSSYRLDDAMNYTARSDAKIAQDCDDSRRVVSVRKIPASEPVYDLTVAPGFLPEFFANGILTHNSSDGEMRAFNDTIHGSQEHLFRPRLDTCYDVLQYHLWGERDPDITYEFEPLHEMMPKEEAEIRKLDAETAQIRIDSGVISQEDERRKIAVDPDSGYHGLDPDDVPDLLLEEEHGLEPEGGRPQPQAEVGEEEGQGEDGGIQNFDDAPTPAEARNQAIITGGGNAPRQDSRKRGK